MKVAIRYLHSPDIYDLTTYVPFDRDNVGFLLQVMAGPETDEGCESFDVQVCTPKWLLNHCSKEEVIIGRHYLIMGEYDYSRLLARISAYCSRIEGSTWEELAEKLGRLGKWEFEDYEPYKN